MSLRIEIVRLEHGQGLPLPFYATPGSAGVDLTAAVTEPLSLAPMQRALVPAGFCMALPEGYEAQVRPRSGLSIKHGITVVNAPGTVDSDYRGEIKIPLINLDQEPFVIKRGLRVAQMVIAPVVQARFVSVETLDETQRGSGGFGSTGTN